MITTGPVMVFAVGVAESVAFTLIVVAPAVVGVPVSEQLLFSVRPAGSVPLTSEQLIGVVPPETPIEPV